MGYRCDVKICMLKENYEVLRERAAKEGYIDHNYLLDEDSMTKTEIGEAVILSWNFIKWDYEFTDVAFVMDFLNDMENEGYPFSFCQLYGIAEFEDTERIYRGPNDDDYRCDYIEIHKEIKVFDTPHE